MKEDRECTYSAGSLEPLVFEESQKGRVGETCGREIDECETKIGVRSNAQTRPFSAAWAAHVWCAFYQTQEILIDVMLSLTLEFSQYFQHLD